MAYILGYFDNTTGSDIVIGSVTLVNGVNTVFYNTDLFQHSNFVSIANELQSGNIIASDINDNVLSSDNAIDSVNETIQEINSLPPTFITVRPFNNDLSKYIIGLLLDYIEDNAVSNSEAATKYDLVNDLASGLWFGSKPITLGHLSNLSDPFFSTAFKDKLTDLVTVGYK